MELREPCLVSWRQKNPLGSGKNCSNLSNLPSQAVEEAIKTLAEERKLIMLGGKNAQALLYSAKGWSRLMDRVKQITGDYHRHFSLRVGIPKEELRSKLKTPAPTFTSPEATCAGRYTSGRRQNGTPYLA